MKSVIGNPKYKIGDEVEFELEVHGIPFRLKGEIFIVDAYGTFEQNEEPSYDIMVEKLPLQDEGAVLVKHIRESSIGGREDVKEEQRSEKIKLVKALTYKYADFSGDIYAKTITKDEELELVLFMVDIYEQQGFSADEAIDLMFEDRYYLAWKQMIEVEE